MKVTPTGIAIALAIVVVLGFFFFGIVNPFAAVAPAAAQPQVPVTAEPTTTNPQGFMITDTKLGTGAVAAAGDNVTVKYTGMFEDGTVFDASSKHPDSLNGIEFVLGAGMVIPGWDQGIAGMKVGGTRHLVIPPELAYGAAGRGGIPPNSTLVFDVELVSVSNEGAQ